jgi:hypothetical protein
MLALEELIAEVKRAKPAIPVALIIGYGDINRLAEQIPMTRDAKSTAYLAGVLLYEDPGLPPGNYQVINDKKTLELRLTLIKYSLTITPDGLIKPADWWVKAT